MTLLKGRFHTLLATALLSIFISCKGGLSPDVLPEHSGVGQVMLYLNSSVVIKSPALVSNFDNFRFRFVGVGNYGSSNYYRYGDVSWPMDWYYGIYKLEAENCSLEESEVSYGKLRFYGVSESFVIANSATASAYVLCKIANAKVSVSFDNAMYESFEDFKLTVESMTIPSEENSEILRTLEFNTVWQSGYFSIPDGAVLLRYTLFVKNFGASEFIEAATGYFVDEEQTEPSEVHSADAITFYVNYVGNPVVSPGIKFIVDGERKMVENELGLEDYVGGSVKEDKE